MFECKQKRLEMAAFPCKPQAWLTPDLGISTVQESLLSLAQTFDSYLTLAMFCPFVNALIQLCRPGTMFFNQSGSDVTSLLFFKANHFHTYPVLRRRKTEFPCIIHRVGAGPKVFDLARKRDLISKRQTTFFCHLYLGKFRSKSLDTSKIVI